MAAFKRLTGLSAGRDQQSPPDVAAGFAATPCRCLADFYREEILKHHRCLELQREYYSEVAIVQAEEALMRLMEQLDCLCQRDDACEVISQLLRRFDAVTRLSAWSESERLH